MMEREGKQFTLYHCRVIQTHDGADTLPLQNRVKLSLLGPTYRVQNIRLFHTDKWNLKSWGKQK